MSMRRKLARSLLEDGHRCNQPKVTLAERGRPLSPFFKESQSPGLSPLAHCHQRMQSSLVAKELVHIR